MPIYEYQCQQCGKRSEVLQKMADPPLVTCEACGGPLKRLISSPAVQFKGSGWYVTDYARKSGGGGSSTSKGDAGEGSAGGATSDSKPAAESKPASGGDAGGAGTGSSSTGSGSPGAGGSGGSGDT